MAVIWFGIGEGSKIFLIVYTTVFIIIMNTAAGVCLVAPNKIRAARALGANDGQIFFLVTLPATYRSSSPACGWRWRIPS